MKRLYMGTYRIREGLSEEDGRKLTKKFAEIGAGPSIIAQYTRLDGQGGFFLADPAEDPERDFEFVLRYGPWLEFELFPVTTMEEAYPVIQRVYS